MAGGSDKKRICFLRKTFKRNQTRKNNRVRQQRKVCAPSRGVQIVVRKTDDEILVIYHGFKKSDGEFEIDIPNGYAISDSFCFDIAELTDGKLLIKNVKEYTAGALLLKR